MALYRSLNLKNDGLGFKEIIKYHFYELNQEEEK
jgi:hypothetical protein